MLKIYGHPKTRSIRVTWMLEELGESYDYQLVNIGKGELRSSEYLSINPAGKLPSLEDNELSLTESAAIVTYLGDKFSASALVPQAGTPERSFYNQWCSFILTELEPPLWTIAKHNFALPVHKRVPEVIKTAEWEFQRALKILSQGLGHKSYILGDKFSAADILLTHTLNWGNNTGHLIEQPNLQDYLKRTSTRPALEKARNREQSALYATQV